jgi:hypothetical protein
MSDAVDNAEVMLSCINLLYKESASECPSTVARLSLRAGNQTKRYCGRLLDRSLVHLIEFSAIGW